MKLLIAIFSYNRYWLLRNMVESAIEYGPEGDIIIIDDGSPDQRIGMYLHGVCQREQKRKVVFLQQDARREKNLHGGLYSNMNLACEWAFKEGYSHIYFTQDDMQFIWQDQNFARRCVEMFTANNDIAMVAPLFMKKFMRNTLPPRCEKGVGGKGCFHIKPYGLCDVGVVPLDLLRSKDWKFRSSENENGKVWREWGFKYCVMQPPHLVWIPWPYARAIQQAAAVVGDGQYLMKPLNSQQIKSLQQVREAEDITFAEDYCMPNRWRCLQPYWFTGYRWNSPRFLLEYLSWCISARMMPKLSPN